MTIFKNVRYTGNTWLFGLWILHIHSLTSWIRYPIYYVRYGKLSHIWNSLIYHLLLMISPISFCLHFCSLSFSYVTLPSPENTKWSHFAASSKVQYICWHRVQDHLKINCLLPSASHSLVHQLASVGESFCTLQPIYLQYSIWKLIEQTILPPIAAKHLGAHFGTAFALMELSITNFRLLSTCKWSAKLTKQHHQRMEQFLPAFCNYDQDNRVKLLPLVELVYTNSIHYSMLMTPFWVNHNCHSTFQFRPPKDSSIMSHVQADLWMAGLEETHQILCMNIIEAQVWQTKSACGTEMTFAVGDKEWLSSRNLRTSRLSRRLDYKRMGPHMGSKIINTNPSNLDLPSPKQNNTVFHVSLLDGYPLSVRS